MSMVGHLENMWQNMITVVAKIKMKNSKDASDIGENMAILNEKGKSFTMLNKETGKLRKIVSEEGWLLVDDSEIDFEAIEKGCPDFEGGKYVEYYFGIFREFKDGVCAICWTVYPDGRYFADEDGFGMEHNNEENAYCIINRDLEIIVPFQPMKDVATVLKTMQVIKLNGEHLTFKGRVHGSVGIEYRIEYDKTAFRMEYGYKYSHPIKDEREMAPGADCKIVTYELTPLKRGIFEIYEVEGFRGQETVRKKHTIVVI